MIRRSDKQYQYFAGYDISSQTSILECRFGESDTGTTFELLYEAIAQAQALKRRIPEIKLEIVLAFESNGFVRHKIPAEVVWGSED